MCFQCYLAIAGIGAFLGLVATWAMKTESLRAIVVDIGTGVGGAILFAWFLAPLSGEPSSQHVSAPEVLGAVFGALVLLALSKAVRPKGWWR